MAPRWHDCTGSPRSLLLASLLLNTEAEALQSFSNLLKITQPGPTSPLPTGQGGMA